MRATTSVAVVLAGLLAGVAVGAPAQTRDTAPTRLAGREVRFRTGLEERRGYLVRLDADSAVVREGGGPLAISRAQLVTLEVRRNARTAAIIGGVVGAAAGALLTTGGECTTSSPGQPERKCSAAERAGLTVLFAALGGAGGAWYLGQHPGWQRLIPASGVPGGIRLADQVSAPPAPAAPEVHAEAVAEPTLMARADTPGVAAQAVAPELPPSALLGHWVRVVTAAGVREGPALRVDSASLVLARNGHAGDTVRIPRAAISELWVSRADQSMTTTGVIVGGIMGGLAGIGVGVLGIRAADRYSSGDPGLIVVAPAIFFASLGVCTGAGMLAGGLIGAHTMRRDWQSVTTPPQLSVRAAGRGRLALTLTLRAGGGGGR